MRHYDRKDVVTVSVHCRDSIRRNKRRFHYILRMPDGYEVDLSGALSGITVKPRTTYGGRFAEIVPSHLRTAPTIVSEFDVSEDWLTLPGTNRGMVLPNAIRGQVPAHGVALQ